MKKISIIALLSLLLITNSAFGESSQSLRNGINLYKNGNYVGCMQSMQTIIKNDPGNSVAHYYLAIAYVKIGQKESAIAEYNKVIKLDTSPILTNYAKQGLSYLGEGASADKSKEQAIKPAANPSISEDAQNKINEQKLNAIKNVTNSGQTPDSKMYNVDKNSSEKLPVIKVPDKSSNNSKPSNDEIVNALQVLQKAGLSNNNVTNPYANNPYANSEALQMSMLMSSLGGGGNNSNGMNFMSMMPFLMNQENGKNIDPKMMQTMLSNMLMPGMMSGFGSNNNDR